MGTAEFGLTGGNDFALKVSDDGLAWRDAMVADPATGHVRFPSGGVREQLTAPRTYFVSPSGNNSNTGLTVGQPFETIQHAISEALNLDPVGYQVTIKLADGTYTEEVSVNRPMHDDGFLSLIGNTASPDSVFIDGGIGTALTIDGTGAVVRVEGIKLQGGIGLWARYGSLVYVQGSMAYGTCTHRHISADNGASIGINGQSSIQGSSAVHLYSETGGNIVMFNTAVTLTGTPHFSYAFIVTTSCGAASLSNNTYAGSATGPQYNSNLNGAFLGGAQTLPGSTAGVTSTGGVYF